MPTNLALTLTALAGCAAFHAAPRPALPALSGRGRARAIDVHMRTPWRARVAKAGGVLAATAAALTVSTTPPLAAPAVAMTPPAAAFTRKASRTTSQRRADRQLSSRTWTDVAGIPDSRRSGGRIVDTAGIIDAAARIRISDTIRRIERDVQGSQVVVVTVDDVADNFTPKRFATELFNYWAIGSMQKDNGVLVLVVKDQRRVEVEVGIGLNHKLSKSWCEAMLNADVIPSFKVGAYGDGLDIGVQDIGDRLRSTDEGPWVSENGGGSDELVAVGGLGLYLGGISLVNAQAERKSRTCAKCGSIVPKEDVGPWRTTRKATLEDGVKARDYSCEKCGHVGVWNATIPKYDGRRSDGTYYHRSSDSSSSGGGNYGGSSSGGGGGASW